MVGGREAIMYSVRLSEEKTLPLLTGWGMMAMFLVEKQFSRMKLLQGDESEAGATREI